MKKSNMFKTIVTAAMALMLAFSLAACGGSGSSSEKTNATTASLESAVSEAAKSGDTVKIGLVQLLENGAFEDMKKGFIDQMAELGYKEGENLEISYKNAQGDMSVLSSISQTFIDKKMDVIVAIATPPAQAVLSALENRSSKIPLVFISVSDPVAAGLVTDLNTTDKNTTGTTNYIPIEDNFVFAEKLTPGIETYGFIYTTGEVNAVATIDDAKKYCDENGIKYIEKVVTNSSEIKQATAALLPKCDALFIPNDSVVQSAMPQIAELAREAKKPVYGSSAVMVDSGAFATISASDIATGAASADIVVEILKGKAVSDIPVVVVKDYDTVINQDTADAIGVTIPEDVKSEAIFVTGIK